MSTRRRPAPRARRPWMGAVSSMRWFVVRLSPPESSVSRPSSTRRAPQPPGPGLPEQAPSVYMATGGRDSGLDRSLMLPSPQGREGEILGGPVEVAAAGLAGDQRGLRAKLLQPLGRDRHPTGAAEVRLGHRHQGEPGAGAEDPVVVGEDVAGELGGQLLALGAHAGQVRLDPAQLVLERGLLAPALALALLEARFGFADVGGEPLLALHEDQDFLLHAGLLLLDLLHLDEDRRVLLVGLHLVEAGLVLGPLGLDDLEVLLLGALVLLGGVEAGFRLLGFLLGALDRGVHGGDLLGEPRRLRFEADDLGVDLLQMDQRLEVDVHLLSRPRPRLIWVALTLRVVAVPTLTRTKNGPVM